MTFDNLLAITAARAPVSEVIPYLASEKIGREDNLFEEKNKGKLKPCRPRAPTPSWSGATIKFVQCLRGREPLCTLILSANSAYAG